MSTADCEEKWNVKDAGIDFFWPIKTAAHHRDKVETSNHTKFFCSPFFSKIEKFKQSDAHLVIETPGKENHNTANMGQRNPRNVQHTPTFKVSEEILNFQKIYFLK